LKHATRQLLSNQAGTAVVELALVLPLLVLLVVGGMHTALILGHWQQANHWAAEAARYAAVGHSPDARALPVAIAARFGGKAKVCIMPDTTGAVGEPVTVRITRTEQVMPLLDLGVGEITVKAEAQMRIERLPAAGEPAVMGGTCT
jgi:Flp pilus assembly protein TadG